VFIEVEGCTCAPQVHMYSVACVAGVKRGGVGEISKYETRARNIVRRAYKYLSTFPPLSAPATQARATVPCHLEYFKVLFNGAFDCVVLW